MPEYVRVRQPDTGHEYSIVASALPGFPDLIVLDKPATRADGTPMRMKPHTTIRAPERVPAGTKAPTAATTGRKANAKKENNR